MVRRATWACRFTSLHKEPRCDFIAVEPESSTRNLDYRILKLLVDIAILRQVVSTSTVRQTSSHCATHSFFGGPRSSVLLRRI